MFFNLQLEFLWKVDKNPKLFLRSSSTCCAAWKLQTMYQLWQISFLMCVDV